MSDTTFKIGSLELPYFRGEYNKAYENERSIEKPLGDWFLDKFKNNVLELGCVMPYFEREEHEIIDLCDTHPKNKKVNGLDYSYSERNVLCISTLEHYNSREYSNSSDDDAIKQLHLIIGNARNWLITFPTTYHPILDDYLKKFPEIKRKILGRVNLKNEWLEDRTESGWNYLFGHRDGRFPDGCYNNANAIVVITNQEEILL